MAAGLAVVNIGGYPAYGGATNVDAGLTFSSGTYTPGSTTYIAGYLDGENRAKYFYTDGATIALPTLTKITQVSIVDAAGNTKTGAYNVILAYTAASPDATSANTQIFLDQFGLLLTAGTAYG